MFNVINTQAHDEIKINNNLNQFLIDEDIWECLFCKSEYTYEEKQTHRPS